MQRLKPSPLAGSTQQRGISHSAEMPPDRATSQTVASRSAATRLGQATARSVTPRWRVLPRAETTSRWEITPGRTSRPAMTTLCLDQIPGHRHSQRVPATSSLGPGKQLIPLPGPPTTRSTLPACFSITMRRMRHRDSARETVAILHPLMHTPTTDPERLQQELAYEAPAR